MTGNQLKILALVAMTIDHIGVILLPQYHVLRIIGRLAFPIFAFMIAEGCRYTHDKRRYLGLVTLVAVICQLGYWIASQSMSQSIMTTFVLGIITVYAFQYAAEKRDLVSLLLVCGALALDLFTCYALPQLLGPWHFHIDYGLWGVLMPLFCILPRLVKPDAEEGKLRWASLACLALCMVLLCFTQPPVQWWSLVALVFLALYNGERGKVRMKYLFYVYYPLHLAAIWGIAQLI